MHLLTHNHCIAIQRNTRFVKDADRLPRLPRSASPAFRPEADFGSERLGRASFARAEATRRMAGRGLEAVPDIHTISGSPSCHDLNLDLGRPSGLLLRFASLAGSYMP